MIEQGEFPKAISIIGFRSFGQEIQTTGPLRRFNFIVGQNNSGKSNVIRALTIISSIFGSDPKYSIRPEDFNAASKRFVIALHFSNSLIRNHLNERSRSDHDVRVLLGQIKETGIFAYPFSIHSNGNRGVEETDVDLFLESANLNTSQLQLLSMKLAGSSGDKLHNGRQVLNRLGIDKYVNNKVLLIPQLRSVHSINQYATNVDPFIGKDRPYCFSGERLIDVLFELQRPPLQKQSDKDKFASIVRFLRYIAGNDTINIEIPHDKSAILVTMDNKTLPLHNLGSGIEELIIMGAASIYFENRIICIEEPELHIHPLLQRKLIEFLRDQTNNMYFITTHSASLIDAPDISIIDVRLIDGTTRLTPIGSDLSVRDALHDLGYRPSDLLQSNSIIWVEGPSDRIYLRKWISICDPTLVEGIDYSIMFYGGKLLAHLSATEQTIVELINVIKINRYSCIVMDSDKKAKGARLNETKRRIISEIETASGIAWVTAGKEIENEIQKEIFLEACKKHGLIPRSDLDDIYNNRMLGPNNEPLNIDKIQLAKTVVELTHEVPSNAAKEVKKIVEFIKRASLKSV